MGRLRGAAVTVAKASISLVAMALVCSHIQLGPVRADLARLGAGTIVATLLAMATIMVVIAGLRLMLMLRAVGIRRSLAHTAPVALCGFFFEQIAFGLVGGDGMRLWLLHAQDVPVRESVVAIVTDRVLGLVALALLAAFGLPRLVHLLTHVDEGVILAGLVGAGVAGLLVAALAARRLALLEHPRVAAALEPVLRAARGAEARRCLAGTFLLAGATHVLTVLIIASLGGSLGLGLALREWFLVVPPAILLSMIPISAGGWGLREACFIVALGTLGVSREQAVVPSVLFGLAILVVTLPGGVIWWQRRRTGVEARAALAASEA